MLAARLPSILPPLSPRELLEVPLVHSIAGDLAGGALTDQRPFRAPHHSASMAALVGGGTRARPGEISLAHQGVLFLDELPEFQPQVLDSLRQTLETGEVAIARANHRIVYPARFQLIAAMNPCRCGHASEPGFSCHRQPIARCVVQYQARLSGPLIDRIDLHVDMPAVAAADLMLPPPAEGSRRWRNASPRRGIFRPRAMPALVFQGSVPTPPRPPTSSRRLLRNPMPGASPWSGKPRRDCILSARGFHRILKLARTIADLDGAAEVGRAHLAEALTYRIDTARQLRAA